MSFEHSPNRLSLLRKQRGLSQKRLATIVGQDRTIISMYERGKVLPSLVAAGMFQLFFGEKIADIFPKLFESLEEKLAQNQHRVANPRKARCQQK